MSQCERGWTRRGANAKTQLPKVRQRRRRRLHCAALRQFALLTDDAPPPRHPLASGRRDEHGERIRVHLGRGIASQEHKSKNKSKCQCKCKCKCKCKCTIDDHIHRGPTPLLLISPVTPLTARHHRSPPLKGRERSLVPAHESPLPTGALPVARLWLCARHYRRRGVTTTRTRIGTRGVLAPRGWTKPW